MSCTHRMRTSQQWSCHALGPKLLVLGLTISYDLSPSLNGDCAKTGKQKRDGIECITNTLIISPDNRIQAGESSQRPTQHRRPWGGLKMVCCQGVSFCLPKINSYCRIWPRHIECCVASKRMQSGLSYVCTLKTQGPEQVKRTFLGRNLSQQKCFFAAKVWPTRNVPAAKLSCAGTIPPYPCRAPAPRHVTGYFLVPTVSRMALSSTSSINNSP